jgi:drug/metabolite transporter (DMT)-like permease
MTSQSRAELVLFSTTFIWGSTFVVVKLSSTEISPSLFVSLRFGLGALLFALFLSKQLSQITKETLKSGILLGVLLGTGIVIQNYGIYLTTASKSAFITGLMVIFTPIAQFVIERQPPKAGNVIGIIIVTTGLYLLTSPDGGGINAGDLLVLSSAAIFGLYIVYLDIHSKNKNPLHLSFVQVSVTSLTAAVTLPFEKIHFSSSSSLLISIFYMGIFATVVTTYSQTRFQKDTTPTRAAVIFTIEPVIAAILAYFMLGEILGTVGIIGGALILTGIAVSEFSDILTARLKINAQTEE